MEVFLTQYKNIDVPYYAENGVLCDPVSRRRQILKMTRCQGAEKRSPLSVSVCLRGEKRRLTGRVNHPPVCGAELQNKV